MAQSQRYELGRRLRVFEEQWEKLPGDDGRKRCQPPLSKAVTAFFTARFGEAGRSLDEARYALEDAKPTEARRWAESLAFFPGGRFFESTQREIAWELKPFYDVPRPGKVEFAIRVVLVVDGKDLFEQKAAIEDLPLKGKLAVKDVKEGDHQLRYEILLVKKPLASGTMQISIANKLTDRLAQLKKDTAQGEGELATERATAQSLVRLLGKLKQGESEETDYPAARLLREVESLCQSVSEKKKFYTRERTGQHWLSLVVKPDPRAEETVVPLRVLVPAKWNEKSPPPLVVALHGAGGSENMFFEGYGNGKIVRLCQERGWMLVAPRVGLRLPLAAVLDELHTRYPFERTKVFLLGHSMGAATAVQAVGLEPTRYAGVVALGGSGTVKASDDLKKVPFYIGVGAQDFALTGARNLKDRLEKAGVTSVTLQELADVEHLGIVQQSLPTAFQFFDKIATPR